MRRAIIIPVHSPKMNWIVSLINSYLASDTFASGEDQPRIVLACSDANELRLISANLLSVVRAKWVELIDVDEYCRLAIGSERAAQAMRQNANGAIVNLKKFVSLHWAARNHIDETILIDVDVMFSHTASFSDIFDHTASAYRSNIVIGTTLGPEESIYRKISYASLGLLAVEDQGKLKNDGTSEVYTWFSSPPFYPVSDVTAFFDYMAEVHGDFEGFLLSLTWHTFDNFVFNLYRSAVNGVEIKSYNHLGFANFAEVLSMTMIDTIEAKLGVKPTWLPFRSVVNDPLLALKHSHVGLLFHVDR
ncbi:hypothetical protein [Rhizobium sp. 9140]|uniref:hypothetical protein n=1 Tax=Rhizobium sp. 9140 TaxID=1761900 RepID=UPI000794EA42|nr:hypothetical protein [Rhizobium sp. 9140]CZT37401.1 hypothetical protein GA0004734_00043440 [Rhizobium sp. 9140]